MRSGGDILSFALLQSHYLLRITLEDPNNSNHPNKTSPDALNNNLYDNFVSYNRIILFLQRKRKYVCFKLHLKLIVPDNAKILLPYYLLLILSLIGKQPRNRLPAVISWFPSMVCLSMLL